mmetsp:Transcript_87225/g.244784  ORF Transcript_87225/g.244784 Transcript_87225/m.244784 type:complete len:245 (-) Transcript_87225:1224-1958(-)
MAAASAKWAPSHGLPARRTPQRGAITSIMPASWSMVQRPTGMTVSSSRCCVRGRRTRRPCHPRSVPASAPRRRRLCQGRCLPADILPRSLALRTARALTWLGSRRTSCLLPACSWSFPSPACASVRRGCTSGAGAREAVCVSRQLTAPTWGNPARRPPGGKRRRKTRRLSRRCQTGPPASPIASRRMTRSFGTSATAGRLPRRSSARSRRRSATLSWMKGRRSRGCAAWPSAQKTAWVPNTSPC